VAEIVNLNQLDAKTVAYKQCDRRPYEEKAHEQYLNKGIVAKTSAPLSAMASKRPHILNFTLYISFDSVDTTMEGSSSSMLGFIFIHTTLAVPTGLRKEFHL
jgi:hypothetical protein